MMDLLDRLTDTGWVILRFILVWSGVVGIGCFSLAFFILFFKNLIRDMVTPKQTIKFGDRVSTLRKKDTTTR